MTWPGPALMGASLLVPALLLLAGCGDGVDTYGVMESQATPVKIEELLETPELHLGKEVRITGQVAQVCQEMGCWFEVMEDDRRLMIDLQMGREFTVPESSAGSWAVVDGTFVRQDGVLKVIGRGVELRGSGPE